jgi:hypothetical protein
MRASLVAGEAQVHLVERFPLAYPPTKFIDFEKFVLRVAIWHGANIDPTEINSGTEK